MTLEDALGDRAQPTITRRRAVTTTASGLLVPTLLTTTATTKENDRLQWSFETGDGIWTSPAVADEKVFVGSTDGKLYAVNTESGEQEWAFNTGARIQWSVPAVADGTVFVGNAKQDGKLYAVDAETGKKNWDFETGTEVNAPTVVDARIFVGTGSGNVYAIDADTGEQQWVFETGRRVERPPTVADGTVFFGSEDGFFYAVDTNTGEQEWAFESRFQNGVTSSAEVVDGTVFFGGGDNLNAVDATTGEREWAFRADSAAHSPTVADGTVFLGGWGSLYAVDATTGEQEWSFEADSIRYSPTVVDGTVFFGSRDNNLYAVDTDSGEQEWAFETGSWVYSSPAVVNGIVYFTSDDGNLYAVDATSKEESGSAAGSTDAGSTGPAANPGSSIFSNPLTVAGGGAVIGPLLGYTLYRVVGSHRNEANLSTGESSKTKASESHSKINNDDDDTSADADRTSIEATSADTADTKPTETDLTEQIKDVESQLTEARQARTDRKYDTAIERCEAALDTAPTAKEALKSANNKQASEFETLVAEARELLEILKSESDAYESVTETLESIRKKIDTAASASTENSQTALEHVSAAEELIDDANTIATENGFDTVTEQLEAQQQRCIDIRERAKKPDRPETVPSPPRLSLTYDDIEKDDPIGSGGNADVYRATATTDSDEIALAIKEPRMSGTIDTTTIDQLINEAETWQQLDDHDHIVSVVDYGSNPLPWIGMEYMDGGDLSERAEGLDFEQALWTALTITKGVRYAHTKGVAHLDLKPENILFRSVENAWDVPKVADWGLSKQLLEHSKSVDGMSPHYAAPEQFDTDAYGQTNNITDVYQLGAVFYELFTGHPPFEGQTFEVIDKIRNEEPTPPSQVADVPAEIDDIILTALATEKDDRYDDVIYIRDKLQGLWEEYS